MNSKQVNATVNRLISFMGDVQDGNLKTILANMQTMCEYQAEKLPPSPQKFTSNESMKNMETIYQKLRKP